VVCFFFSSRRRHTRFSRDWSSDVCSSDLAVERAAAAERRVEVLTEQDRLRGLWYGETAGEREITERSKAELLARGVDLDAEPKEIGRASCREREEVRGGGDAIQQRRDGTS